MTPLELYACWAPNTSPWSAWAKPVLFAELPSSVTGETCPVPLPFSVDAVPAADGHTLLVVDLPGADAVHAGLELARRGYRPVPLFNAASGGAAALVEVTGLQAALVQHAEEVSRLPLAPTAPPAFLLDSRRLANGAVATPGRFDNRWVALPQDFPSANRLLAEHLREAVLVQAGQGRPPDDLAHVLLRWQQGGVHLACTDAQAGHPPVPLTVARPRWFGAVAYRVLVTLGLRRNSAGGFGAIVPVPSQSHG